MPRHIPLQGASNFRDFGDYSAGSSRIRSGRLFRSDRLSDLTPDDHANLSPLGIELIIDLRRSSERSEHPTHWPGEAAPQQWHVPVFEDGADEQTLQQLALNPEARTDPAVSSQIMTDIYRAMIVDAAPRAQFRRIFERLADASAPPFLIHCSGGKDRTGVLSMLLLGALGAHRDDIMADFLLTQRYYDGVAKIEEKASQIFAHANIEFSTAALLPIFTVQQEYLEAALAEIDARSPSINDYLTNDLGIATATIDSLREHLLA